MRITLAPLRMGKDGQGALVDLQSWAVKDMVWGCPWCFRRSPWMFWTKDDQIKTAIESAQGFKHWTLPFWKYYESPFLVHLQIAASMIPTIYFRHVAVVQWNRPTLGHIATKPPSNVRIHNWYNLHFIAKQSQTSYTFMSESLSIYIYTHIYIYIDQNHKH